jgi:hypothetical protein
MTTPPGTLSPTNPTPGYTPPSLAGLPPAAAPAPRRRPLVFLLGLALVALGGTAGYYAVSQQGDRTAVLALARTVPYGQQITAADLVVAHITADPALAPVPAGDANTVIGHPAATTLYAGQVLVSSDVVTGTVVPRGSDVVFVPIPNDRINSAGLSVEQAVTLVYAPTSAADANTGAGADTGGAAAPTSVNGVILSVAPPTTDGTIVIAVIVPSGQASTVATWAQTGSVELTAAAAG